MRLITKLVAPLSMKITKFENISIYIFCCLFSFLIFYLVNDIYFNNNLLIDLLGLTVAIFWVGLLIIFMLSGVNKAASKNYVGFLFVLGLFHLGIPLGGFFEYGNDYYDKNLSRWYYSEYTIKSFIVVYLFLVGYAISNIFPVKSLNFKSGFFCFNNEYNYKLIFILYLSLVLLWIFFVRFISGVSNYTLYAEGNASSNILNAFFVYGNNLIGFLFVLLCLNKKYAKNSLITMFFWAIFALPIGLRGEVFFPIVMSIPFLINNNIIRLNIFKLTSMVIIILTGLSAIFIYRHGEAVEGTEINPLATIIEMGGSLRPVYESIKWIEGKELNFFYGETYWAPIERVITKIIPYIDRLPANEDMRLMNVVILNKAGPYGFSIIGESFINFSYLGTVFIGLICGLFLKSFDLSTSKNNFLILALVFALFFHIRQSFVGGFAVFSFSIIFCLTLKLIFSLLEGKYKK